MMIKYTIKKCNGLIWMEEPMGQEQHRATTRVLDILEHLASEGGAGKTLTELSVALDAPKSSLFPILHTLAQRRYVRLDRETGRENVDRYGDEAEFSTPLDNPYVLKLLRLLGFDTVEEFLEQSDIFIRHF